jgi:protein-tyrosine phosphatase
MKPVRICFVCLGNICRSPTADAVMRHLVREAGLDAVITVDSAGTGDWHVGRPRDPRSGAVGARRGIPLSGVARQFSRADFERFDLVVAMDHANQRDLLRMAAGPDDAAKVVLLRAFEPGVVMDTIAPGVPDPYQGGPEGFEEVFDICLRACAGMLAHLRCPPGA